MRAITSHHPGLLVGEGHVGHYEDLLKKGRRRDNLTPHHIPANAFMAAKVPGYTKGKGVAMMMEHPMPGQGGRHRQTLSYGQTPDLGLTPREALAKEVADARSIYVRQGLYTKAIRSGLRQVMQLNQLLWVGSFDK